MAGHRESATTQIESIPASPPSLVSSLDRDDRGDPLVRFTQYRSTGLNAEERYGLQKYRFPITDRRPSHSHRRSSTPFLPFAISLLLGLDTETIQHARGRKRVLSSLSPVSPVCYSPLSSVHPPSLVSVPRLSQPVILFPRTGAPSRLSSTVSVLPI